jgi:hypothetical protein
MHALVRSLGNPLAGNEHVGNGSKKSAFAHTGVLPRGKLLAGNHS